VVLSTRYTTPDTTVEIGRNRQYECDRGIIPKNYAVSEETATGPARSVGLLQKTSAPERR